MKIVLVDKNNKITILNGFDYKNITLGGTDRFQSDFGFDIKNKRLYFFDADEEWWNNDNKDEKGNTVNITLSFRSHSSFLDTLERIELQSIETREYFETNKLKRLLNWIKIHFNWKYIYINYLNGK